TSRIRSAQCARGTSAPGGRRDVIVVTHVTSGVHSAQRNRTDLSVLLNFWGYGVVELGSMRTVDDTDRRLLLAMTENPRSTIVSLAERLVLSRNTVKSRHPTRDAAQAIHDSVHLLHAASLRHPLTASIGTQVDQRRFVHVIGQLREIQEVVQVHVVSSLHYILVRCVKLASDDIYRVN